MKLTVPTNWQADLLKKISKPEVDTVYGKLKSDFIGGLRLACYVADVSEGDAASHIRKIHKIGMKFEYLLNATCMGENAWGRAAGKRLHKLLAWLAGVKVDGIVVAIPQLASIIRKYYPNFTISVSSGANVNSVEKARFWEDLGALTITLPQVEVNRNLDLLKKIKENVRCELQLIVNSGCLQDCPFFFAHNNFTSHGSKSNDPLCGVRVDYYRLWCKDKIISDPANFIRVAWIRPEDLAIYEGIGIHRFKIVDRMMRSDVLALITNAYAKRSYKGNLYDLLMDPSKGLALANNGKLKQALQVYINNTRLEGFLEHFPKGDCRNRSCAKCGYCARLAKKAVRIDPQYSKEIAKKRALSITYWANLC